MAKEIAPKLSPARLSHIAIRTNNLPAMSKWYKHMLAASATHEDANSAFLKTDEELLRVALIQIPNTAGKNAQTCGLEHFAFTFDTLADLCNMYKERKELGYIPYRAVHHGPTISMYYLGTYRDGHDNTTSLETSARVCEKTTYANVCPKNRSRWEQDGNADRDHQDRRRF